MQHLNIIVVFLYSLGVMDWYSGSGIDDLIVPKDGGLSDRLPSPDSWSKWGIGATESFPPHNKCGSSYHQNFYTEDCFRSLYDDVEMEDFVLDKCQSSTSSACGGSSDDSVLRTILSNNQPDYQLELGGSRQMDDIFLYSVTSGIKILDLMPVGSCIVS